MHLCRVLRNCTQFTQKGMGHERPEEGTVPAVTGGASCTGVQRALDSVSKASRVQMGRGNGRPVFKEYCRPCRVKNSDKAEMPDLGAKRSDQRLHIFPYGTVLHGTHHFRGNPPRWLPPIGPCNVGRTPTIGIGGGRIGHLTDWPPR